MVKKTSSLKLARTIAEAALEKQATNVVILDLLELDAITDCFVICTGEVHQQVRAISENIEKQVKAKTKDRLLHREGMDTNNWVILDYVNVVAHIFKPSFREFYRLENLWGDAETIPVEDKAAVKRKPVRRKAAKATADERAPKSRRRKLAVKARAVKSPGAVPRKRIVRRPRTKS